MSYMKRVYDYWLNEVAEENQRAASSEVQADLLLEWLIEGNNLERFRKLMAVTGPGDEDDEQLSLDLPEEVH